MTAVFTYYISDVHQLEDRELFFIRSFLFSSPTINATLTSDVKNVEINVIHNRVK